MVSTNRIKPQAVGGREKKKLVTVVRKKKHVKKTMERRNEKNVSRLLKKKTIRTTRKSTKPLLNFLTACGWLVMVGNDQLC
jgi:predicted ribosome quality control (RQC) complex YloA/Tae2 family protein